MKRLLLTLFLVAGLMLGLAPGALAEGAVSERVVAQEAECFGTSGGTQFCYRYTLKQHITITPSGNQSVAAVYDYSDKYTVAGVVTRQQDYDTRYHFLVKDGVLQENHGKGSYAYTLFGESCALDFHYHYANDQVQFQRQEVGCVPIP